MEKFIFLSTRVKETSLEKYLIKMGVFIIYIDSDDRVYKGIDCHPDIFMTKFPNVIFVEPTRLDNIFLKNVDVVEKLNKFLVKGDSEVGLKYPDNIIYNSVVLGKFFIHNLKYTDKKVLEEVNKLGLIKINVNQGYTKCSLAIVDENAVITSDAGIEKELKKYGIDVLKIDEGNIFLEGKDHGFIGGTSGLIDDKIIFFGNISKHPDYLKIKKFVISKGKTLIYFQDFEIEDIGSIISFTL